MSAKAWREADLEPDVPDAARRTRALVPWGAGLLALASLLLYLHSQGRAEFRCRQECYGAPPLDGYGSRTYEPGHSWTHYANAWQWSVQHGLTQVAVVSSLVGLGLAATSRRAWPAFAVTAVALGAWAVWLALSPAVPG